MKCSAAPPQSLTFKGKISTSLKYKEKATELDTRSYKCLLLALVKLIHADPRLMLHVRLRNSLVMRLITISLRLTYFLAARFWRTYSPEMLWVFRVDVSLWMTTSLCLSVSEPGEAGSRDAEQHGGAHHWPGAAGAAHQYHPAVPGSHGGQTRPHPFTERTTNTSLVMAANKGTIWEKNFSCSGYIFPTLLSNY